MHIDHTSRYITVGFDYPLRVLSCAPVRGGFRRAISIVNLKTETQEVLENTPEKLIGSFLMSKELPEDTVGLLTAADMEYAQFIALEESGIGVLAVVTAGISNALNITERSDTEFSGEAGNAPGTINIIAVTNGCLLDECMVSSMITATEAKTAALMELGVRSVVSGTQATGTGTDTVVVVSGNGANIRYAGGHTLYGQLLGEAVYLGVKRSLQEIASGIGSFESLYTLFNF